MWKCLPLFHGAVGSTLLLPNIRAAIFVLSTPHLVFQDINYKLTPLTPLLQTFYAPYNTFSKYYYSSIKNIPKRYFLITF